MTNVVRWGIVGCGDVTEVKSGPALQKARGSTLVAVMRRDRSKAEDYARRHGVERVHETAEALIDDPDVDAVYIATPPSSHCDLALRSAAAGKPCLVEKPMARTHAECVKMNDAFEAAGVPLWVAYYRRALPRFVLVRDLLEGGTIGSPTSVHIEMCDALASGERAAGWRFDPAIAGAGLFFDLASHALDLVDFLMGAITDVAGRAINTGRTYRAEDVTVCAFAVGGSVVGTGVWNFNAAQKRDSLLIVGTAGEIRTPVFSDDDVVVWRQGAQTIHRVRNPPHVHQPLVQTIVDELRGSGQAASSGRSAARTSWVLERCVAGYYGRGSGIGDRGSGIGDQGSGIGDQGSGIGDPGIRDRGQGIGSGR